MLPILSLLLFLLIISLLSLSLLSFLALFKFIYTFFIIGTIINITFIIPFINAIIAIALDTNFITSIFQKEQFTVFVRLVVNLFLFQPVSLFLLTGSTKPLFATDSLRQYHYMAPLNHVDMKTRDKGRIFDVIRTILVLVLLVCPVISEKWREVQDSFPFFFSLFFSNGELLWYFTLKVQSCRLKKTLINDRLRASKVFWKFRIPLIYIFAVIHPWNLLFS